MHLLGIDLETSGLEPGCKITEIGGGLYHATGKKTARGEPIWEKEIGFSHLCYEPNYQKQTTKIIELTGITDEMLITRGHSRLEVLKEILPIWEKADFVIAHNKSFDERVLMDTCKELNFELPKKEFFCSIKDIPHPDKITCKKLSHMALDYGIPVDPRSLHRTEADVDLMMRIVSLYDLSDILLYAREPWILVKANIFGPWIGPGGDGGVQKDIAKMLGFSWEKAKNFEMQPIPKTWLMRVKEFQLPKIIETINQSTSPFEIERV